MLTLAEVSLMCLNQTSAEQHIQERSIFSEEQNERRHVLSCVSLCLACSAVVAANAFQ